jgi:hypothetical protein
VLACRLCYFFETTELIQIKFDIGCSRQTCSDEFNFCPYSPSAPKRDEVAGEWRDCVMRSFMICTHRILFG